MITLENIDSKINDVLSLLLDEKKDSKRLLQNNTFKENQIKKLKLSNRSFKGANTRLIEENRKLKDLVSKLVFDNKSMRKQIERKK